MIQRFAALSLAVVLTACNSRSTEHLAVARVETLPSGIVSVTSPGPTAWADTASGWRLVPAGTIGGESGTPGELIDPQSLAVDDAGRVYVADDKPVVIKVFAPDGRFLHTIGREGEGPGEFKATFIAVHGSNLVVHDPRVSRTSVFDTSGAFLRSWTSSCCYYGPIGVDTAGRISVMTMATPEQKRMVNFVRYTLAGALVDTVIVPSHGEAKYWTVKQGRNSMMSTGIPASPRVVSALDPFGGVLYGFSDEYRIAASTTGRDTTRLFGRAWTPKPVSAEWRHATVERMVTRQAKYWPEASLRSAFREDDIPGTFPAFEGISVDREGDRWVRLSNAGDTTSTLLDVFDRSGRYLGAVKVGRLLPAYGAAAWGRDDFYAALESEDGLPTIVRFHIERGRPRR